VLGNRSHSGELISRHFRDFGNAPPQHAISRRMNSNSNSNPDVAKGAIESDRPEDDADGNVAGFREQLDHRFQDPLNKSSDAGMPGTGQTEEFSMEEQGENELRQDTNDTARPRGPNVDSEANTQDQTPGNTQKRNQGDKDEDPLAA